MLGILSRGCWDGDLDKLAKFRNDNREKAGIGIQYGGREEGAGILEIGEARDISNPGEPPQLSGPTAPAPHRRGEKDGR